MLKSVSMSKKGIFYRSPAWSSDFTYEYFRNLFRAIRADFECYFISEAPSILNATGKSKLLMRHDVDIDLNRALRMAEIDSEFGVRACFMVMVNSPLYSVEDPSSQSILNQITSLGHEVGLHFDHRQENSDLPIDSVERNIRSACERLETVIGQPVRSISFHRPLPPFLRGPLLVTGRVNAYARELMTCYLSDSKGKWREGEPLPRLLSPDRPLLQLLVHPIWWGDAHMSPEDRLQAFFDAVTVGRSREWIQIFDTALAGHLSVRRSGWRRK